MKTLEFKAIGFQKITPAYRKKNQNILVGNALSLGTNCEKWLNFRSRFHQNVYTLNLFNVLEGLSGDWNQPVVKFLRCALQSYDRFSKGHSAAEGCNLKNI